MKLLNELDIFFHVETFLKGMRRMYVRCGCLCTHAWSVRPRHAIGHSYHWPPEFSLLSAPCSHKNYKFINTSKVFLFVFVCIKLFFLFFQFPFSFYYFIVVLNLARNCALWSCSLYVILVYGQIVFGEFEYNCVLCSVLCIQLFQFDVCGCTNM